MVYVCFNITFYSLFSGYVCEIKLNTQHSSPRGSVPIRRNPIRRILKKYIVWVNAVVLWKKSYSVILRLRNIPSMQHYILLILRHSCLARKTRESLCAFKKRRESLRFSCV